MQVSASPGKFASWVNLYPVGRTYDPHHLPFRQNFAASHAGPLGYMLYALSRFLDHLQYPEGLLPITFAVAAFVLLAANDFAEVFVELEGNALLLALLAGSFLLVVRFVIGGGLEDLWLHLE